MTVPSWWDAFTGRVERLRVLIPQAIEDGERDVPISSASLDNAIAFARTLTDVQQPGTFIQNDGLARLVWQSGKQEGVCQFTEQVAIKFRETDLVEFVFFRVENEEMRTSDIMGIAHVGDVLGLVADLRLGHVMTAPR